jgi:hypothetical protein
MSTISKCKFPVVINVKKEYYSVMEAANKVGQKPFALFLSRQLLEQYATLEKPETD